MMASLRARAVVRVAEVLRCRDELLEVVSEGSLRFLRPSRADIDETLAATGLRYSDLTAEHPLFGVRVYDRRSCIRRIADAFSFPPKFFRGSDRGGPGGAP